MELVLLPPRRPAPVLPRFFVARVAPLGACPLVAATEWKAVACLVTTVMGSSFVPLL
jgi:hypothetical protein